MSSASQIHLPAEIVVQIVAEVAADSFARQTTLHACCLVSRQWYSCAVTVLYEKPRIDTGHGFSKFTDTICPPLGARKSKWNLGGLVHKLDLSSLVHHSSPSLTARLLGRVKENLEVLLAPRVSFSSNSLPALSKCSKLRLLDLSLVATPIAFSDLKRSISKLQNLHTLRLPQSTSITNSDSDAFREISWPPNLRRVQFSGHFSAPRIRSFPWPPFLTNLTLKNCSDLSLSNLSYLMSNPDLARTLKRLTISGQNRHLHPESINAMLAYIPPLSYLSIPGDMVDATFLDVLCHISIPSLEVLEFGQPSIDPTVWFKTDALIKALEHGLPNVRAVGFAEIFCSVDGMLDDDAVDEFLLDRAEVTKKSLQLGAEMSEPSVHMQPGVYYV